MLETVHGIVIASKPREIMISEQSDLPEREQREQQTSNQDAAKPEQMPSLANDEDTVEIATLSVIRFLESILEERLETSKKATPPQWFSHNHANMNISRQAAYAYEHAAEISKVKLMQIQATRTRKTPAQTPDIGDLYAMLRQLREAYRSNITVLPLRQDLSFYESIKHSMPSTSD